MSNIKHPNINEFNELIQNEKVLVDFFATWCGPCKMLGPELEKLANNVSDDVVIIKVDVDQYPELAAQYRIQSVPTLLRFKNGKLVEQVSGYRPYPQLLNMVK